MSLYLPTPLDMMHLPAQFQGDVQVFLTENRNVNWQTWTKPRGVSMCLILAVSGGGGGGSGHSRAAGNAGGGGGGGGTGGLARTLIPACFLPDILYVQVGIGGRGSAGAGSAGESGTITAVSLGRSTANPNLIVSSSAGGAGTAGTGVSAGGAGGAGSATTGTPPVLGVSATTGGVTGGAGGAQTGAVGASVVSVWNGVPISGGAGGAGCTTTNFAGGGVTLQGTPDFAAQSLSGGTAGGGNGDSGVQLWQPFYTTGGAGGGSNNSGAAGSGGKGGIGSGGGGGGAGTTGGRGGDGGNGMVLIISW